MTRLLQELAHGTSGGIVLSHMVRLTRREAAHFADVVGTTNGGSAAVMLPACFDLPRMQPTGAQLANDRQKRKARRDGRT
jgi:hypothetical protein